MRTPFVFPAVRHLLCLGGLFLSAAALSAALPRTVFEFGSEEGRVSLVDAGFRVIGEDNVQLLQMPVALQMRFIGDGFLSAAFVREFPALEGVHRDNFTANLATRIMDTSGSNNRRFGITLFGVPDIRRGGLFAGVMVDRNAGQQILFRNGHDGEILAHKIIPGGVFQNGDTFDFQVEGIYEGDKLHLTLTITSRDAAEQLSITVDPARYPGNLFGGGGRLREGWIIDFSRFELGTR